MPAPPPPVIEFFPPGCDQNSNSVSDVPAVNETIGPLDSPSTAPPAVVTSGHSDLAPAEYIPAPPFQVSTVTADHGHVFEQFPPAQQVRGP